MVLVPNHQATSSLNKYYYYWCIENICPKERWPPQLIVNISWPIIHILSWILKYLFFADNSSNEVCFPGNINNNNLTLNGARGTFQTPKGYPVNSSCDWLITVPEGNIVKLVFDSFHLESDRYSRVCLRDYVEVLDGNSSSSASKGRFCGNRSPEKIRSSGRYMWVRFRSDNVWSWHTGFMATFTAEDNSGM